MLNKSQFQFFVINFHGCLFLQNKVTIVKKKYFFKQWYSKTLRYADFGPKLISVAQKTVYLEVTWKPFKTLYLWGFIPKNDNQCNFWQNLKPYIFKISASWGRVAQGFAFNIRIILPTVLYLKFWVVQISRSTFHTITNEVKAQKTRK